MATRQVREIQPGPLEIFQSELEHICAAADMWGRLETCGDIYGLYNRCGHPVCLLCTAPGPNATHEAAHCAHDPELFTRAQQVLRDSCGVTMIGAQHSHAGLDLDRPSAGDQAQVVSFTQRNDLESWAELILNPELPDARSWRQGARAPDGHPPRVRVSAFIYTNPQEGVAHRVGIRVIRGFSPIRLWLLATGALAPADIGAHMGTLPMERIVYEPFDLPQRSPDAVPEGIVEQIRGLPEEAQKGLSVSLDHGRVTVALTFAGTLSAEASLSPKPPHAVQSICVMPDEDREDAIDITTELIECGQPLSLAAACKMLARPGFLQQVQRAMSPGNAAHLSGGDHRRDSTGST